MKILITGANGFLGQHLCRSLVKSHSIWATGRGEKRLPFQDVEYLMMDLEDTGAVRQVVLHSTPEVIIHAAAMSRPDECEANKEKCYAINVKGTAYLVEAALSLKAPPHFVYVSSDFVMGDNGPHDENVLPSPLNYYGTTKLEAERVVAAPGLPHTIVRPVFMYGETWPGMRGTFLQWVSESLKACKRIQVVSDQMRTPTYIGDICEGISTIIRNKCYGLYHLAGEEVLSPYEMALQMAERAGLDTSLIEAVTANAFPEPVQRAKRGGLLVEKAKRALGFAPVRFAAGLDRMMHNY